MPLFFFVLTGSLPSRTATRHHTLGWGIGRIAPPAVGRAARLGRLVFFLRLTGPVIIELTTAPILMPCHAFFSFATSGDVRALFGIPPPPNRFLPSESGARVPPPDVPPTNTPMKFFPLLTVPCTPFPAFTFLPKYWFVAIPTRLFTHPAPSPSCGLWSLSRLLKGPALIPLSALHQSIPTPPHAISDITAHHPLNFSLVGFRSVDIPGLA